MSNFALNTTDPYGEVISSVNYLLSNLGTAVGTDANVLIANVQNGEITSNGSVVSYLYQYMSVQYANSSTGGSGFSSNSYNRSYYGLRNTANANPISFNPTDYVWYQVTGGFGTTKTLWYQTIGGRQVQFFPNVSAPAASFITVPDMPSANSTPLNLDTITSAQNNQIVNVNAYYQANVTPATPAGGTYNFTTFVLTPPSGWTSNIPSSGNTSVYVSTATFVGNTDATAAPPATGWTLPTVYSSQFQGNTGPAGTRGFVPMGFVITASDPTTYGNVDFTNAFEASRSNPSPPIGLGFAPIANDTAQFAYEDLFTNNTITTVQQYNGTGWLPVVGEVISGGLFVPGSINANTLNVNQVYALTIASTNANVGNVASNGFWLDSGTGDARFGGNVSIGANLNVDGLITVGTLNANTVGGGQIVIGSITGNLIATATINGNSIIANSFEANTINGGAITANSISANALIAGTIIAANSIQSASAVFGSYSSPGYWLDSSTGNVRMAGSVSIGNNLTVGTNAQVGNNLKVGNNLNVGTNAQIGGNLNVTGLITTSALNANTVITNTIVSAAVTNQGTGYSNTDNIQTGGGSAYAWTDTSTQTSIATNSITSGGIMNISGRSMVYIYLTTGPSGAPHVLNANLAIFAQTGSTTADPLGWANVQRSFPNNTTGTVDLETVQNNYPYVLTGNSTITIFARVFGTQVSGNINQRSATFDNYSELTGTRQLRFLTGQAFKR